MTATHPRSPRPWVILTTALAILAAGAWGVYRWGLPERVLEPFRGLFPEPGLPDGFVSANGRIEATEIDIATKLPGRLAQVLVREGDRVAAGAVVARVDTTSLEAEKRQAQAESRRARQDREYALAVTEQRQIELDFARRELRRLQELVERKHVSEERADQARTEVRTSEAALRAAQVKVAETDAAIESAAAMIERIAADIADCELKAPRDGRVLYRLAEVGEVLGVGGKVFTLLDLTDVYMIFFLPETVVGRVAIGAQARLVLDAAPEFVIPAVVSFVAPRAQFTPKQVETRSEREKLVFRVKAHIAADLLRRYEPLVKTGLPGVVYVRLNADAPWPDRLNPRLPPWSHSSTPSQD